MLSGATEESLKVRPKMLKLSPRPLILFQSKVEESLEKYKLSNTPKD